MPGYESTNAVWMEAVLVLSTAIAGIFLLAALATRFARSGVWQRTIWQATVSAACLLVLCELLGAGPAASSLLRAGLPIAQNASDALAPDIERPAMVAAAQPSAAAFHDETAVSAASSAVEALPAFNEPDAAAISRRTETASVLPVVPAVQGVESTNFRLLHTDWLGVLWIAGALAVLLPVIRARLMLAQFRRRQARIEQPALRQEVDRLARRLGIRRRVLLLEASGLQVPVAFGLLRPTLVLPAGFEETFDREEQQAILAHELAHLAARDPAWQLLADLLCAALWWHPLAWWSRSRLRAASETAADEACLLVPGGPDVLAGCLVALARNLIHPRRLGWLSIEGSGFRSGLGRRVERLLNLQTQPRQAPTPRRLAIARIAFPLALVLISLFSTAWARPQATLHEGETTMNLMKHSWQRSLAAVVLTAWIAPNVMSAEREHDGPPPPKEKPSIHHPDVPRPDGEHGERREKPEKPAPRLHDGPPAEMNPEMRELMQKRRQLEAARREIEEKLHGLRDGQDAEARELREQMEKVQQQIREVNERMPERLRAAAERMREGEGPMAPVARERVRRAMEEFEQRIRELRAAGKNEEAEAVRRQAQELQRRVQAMQEGRGPMPGAMNPEERERRMNALRKAAENLREAGMGDLAERLMQEAEMRQRGGPRPEGGEMGRPFGPPEGLMNEIRQLRREVEELRAALRASRGEGERREGDRPRGEGERRDGDRPRGEGERRDRPRPEAERER